MDLIGWITVVAKGDLPRMFAPVSVARDAEPFERFMHHRISHVLLEDDLLDRQMPVRIEAFQIRFAA